MITQPTTTNPKSRRGRAERLLRMALPIVLLVGVVGAGVLGQPREPRPPAQSAAAIASLDAGPIISPLASARAAGPAPALAAVPEVPTVAGDLAVRTVTEAMAARAASPADRVVAVAGFLVIPDPPTSCVDPVLGPLGPLCERIGILAEQPPGMSGGGLASLGPHLHPRFPVGVSLPDAIRSPGSPGPRTVVVLGRFESRGASCGPSGARCDEAFVVDRVIWIDGAWLPSTPVIDAGLDGNPREWVQQNQQVAEIAALGWSGTILVEALLRPATLAAVDPVAATALAAGPAPAARIWYVRGLETGYDPIRYPLGQSPPRLNWIVLDDVTQEVLARRPPPAAAS